jgi:hypothetical protein
MPATEYQSPPARLARLFRKSRDNWKSRAAGKQAAIKKMRVTLRDLTDSREHWKALALQQAKEMAALRQQTQPQPSLGGA